MRLIVLGLCGLMMLDTANAAACSATCVATNGHCGTIGGTAACICLAGKFGADCTTPAVVGVCDQTGQAPAACTAPEVCATLTTCTTGCGAVTCQNGGTCGFSSVGAGVGCRCATGYYGDTCATAGCYADENCASGETCVSNACVAASSAGAAVASLMVVLGAGLVCML